MQGSISKTTLFADATKTSLPSTKVLSLKVKDDYSRMNSIIIGKRQVFIG